MSLKCVLALEQTPMCSLHKFQAHTPLHSRDKIGICNFSERRDKGYFLRAYRNCHMYVAILTSLMRAYVCIHAVY